MNFSADFVSRVIRSESEYDRALAIAEPLVANRNLTNEESKFLSLIVTLIEDYEGKHYPMGDVSPHAALLHLMEISNFCCLQLLTANLKAEIVNIARTTETAISIQQTLHIRPTLADPQIMRSIEGVCQNMGLAYDHMPSRAGHDAQEIGRFTDMGMIFVPSRSGVSHSADEYTSPEECDRGANVLLQTFQQIDNFHLKKQSPKVV